MTCAVLSIGTELTRGELANSNAVVARLPSSRALGFEVDRARRRSTTTAAASSRRSSGSPRRRASSCAPAASGRRPTTSRPKPSPPRSASGSRATRPRSSTSAGGSRSSGAALSASNAKQADFPDGADILPNPVGTAPGFGVRVGECVAYFLPGVPREMKKMFEEQVVPRIRALAPNNLDQSRLRTFGLPESVVGEKLAGVEQAFPGTTIGYRAHFPEIEVKVLAARRVARRPRATSASARRRRCAPASARTCSATARTRSRASSAGRCARGAGRSPSPSRARAGSSATCSRASPGASDFLLLDAVTYANSAKSRILGVDEETIRWHGAVSSEVAARDGQGAKRVSGADLALALTGVAGPSGGSEEKPVGTVYIALAQARRHRRTSSTASSRATAAQIQTLAAYAGLQLVRELRARRGGDRPERGRT